MKFSTLRDRTTKHVRLFFPHSFYHTETFHGLLPDKRIAPNQNPGGYVDLGIRLNEISETIIYIHTLTFHGNWILTILESTTSARSLLDRLSFNNF